VWHTLSTSCLWGSYICRRVILWAFLHELAEGQTMGVGLFTQTCENDTFSCRFLYIVLCVIWTRTSLIWTLTSVIYTRILWRTDVISTRSVISTRTSVIFTHMSVILTRKSVILTRKSVILTRKSVITTPTNVNYSSRVWFPHAECDFYTQIVISTHECVLDTYECDYDTHECDYDTHEFDFNTHKRYLYTHSVMYGCDSYTQSYFHMQCDFDIHECDLVTLSVTSTCRVWFLHARVVFQHAACDFKTNQLK
jgi:hypothetical protein